MEYLKQLARANNCDSAGLSERNLYLFYEALYYEAKELSVTNEQKKELKWFRWVAATTATAVDDYDFTRTNEENEAAIAGFLKEHLQ
jgi:hypothetical protein